MPTHTENWTYAEFHAFTMLYAANADGRITLEEEKRINQTLSSDEYARVKSAFLGMDDASALDLILLYGKKYCKTQADKDRILADMLAVYKSDAHFDQIERGVHQLFEKCFE